MAQRFNDGHFLRRHIWGDNVSRLCNERSVCMIAAAGEGNRISLWCGLSVRERRTARPNELRQFYLRQRERRRALRNFIRSQVR
jgi:hypothetical protein